LPHAFYARYASNARANEDLAGLPSFPIFNMSKSERMLACDSAKPPPLSIDALLDRIIASIWQLVTKRSRGTWPRFRG
jgi:hypothetical protein